MHFTRKIDKRCQLKTFLTDMPDLNAAVHSLAYIYLVEKSKNAPDTVKCVIFHQSITRRSQREFKKKKMHQNSSGNVCHSIWSIHKTYKIEPKAHNSLSNLRIDSTFINFLKFQSDSKLGYTTHQQQKCEIWWTFICRIRT